MTCTWPTFGEMDPRCWVWHEDLGGHGFIGWWGGAMEFNLSVGLRWLDGRDLGSERCE